MGDGVPEFSAFGPALGKRTGQKRTITLGRYLLLCVRNINPIIAERRFSATSPWRLRPSGRHAGPTGGDRSSDLAFGGPGIRVL
jgi:hypothetical protein